MRNLFLLFRKESGKELKALLIMDNYSAHCDEELLISGDGLFKVAFLPPTVTSLFESMDHGVLETMKQ